MNTPSQSPGSDAQHRNSAAPEDHLSTLQDDAQAALASAREHDSAQFEQYRDTAAQQIETLAHSAQSAAEQLQEDDTFGLSHYVTDIAQNMTTLAGSLRGKSVDELLQQAGKLARDNPALFITGSVALGLGLSRFLRASSSLQSSNSTAPPADPTSTPGTDPFDDAPARQDATRPTTGMSSVVEADQEFPVSHPHMGDVRHSGRPGVVDTSIAPGAQIPTNPLDPGATYPDSKDDSGQPGNPGQPQLDRQAQDSLTKGDR